jgi:hypothetical protein
MSVWKGWVTAIIAMVFISVALVYIFVDRREVIKISKIDLDPKEVRPGEAAYFVVGDIDWFRENCPTQEPMRITDSQGNVTDFTHTVDYPMTPVHMHDKQRLMDIPRRRLDGDGVCRSMCSGLATLEVYFLSTCVIHDRFVNPVDVAWPIRTRKWSTTFIIK